MQQEGLEINIIFIVIFGVILLIIITLILLFITFNNRKNKLIQQQLSTELEHQKKIHDSELKALRGQMNPHFIHNSLNAIQYYIQRNEVEICENYLAKFSKLMRLFFDYSRNQTITIKEEIHLLENYLFIEKLRFEENLEYSIIVDNQLDIDEVQIPSMILQPIVENAVNHGLFHKIGKGTVTIEFKTINKKSFKVSVIDDGIGINKALKLNKTISKEHKSHSTTVTEERINLFKISNNWDIEYTITDLSNQPNLSGTEVTLLFNQML